MKKYWKSAVIFLIVILTTFGMVACKKPDMVDLKKT